MKTTIHEYPTNIFHKMEVQKKPRKKIVIENREIKEYKYETFLVINDTYDHTIIGKFPCYPKYLDDEVAQIQILNFKDCEGLGDKDGEIPLKKGDIIKVVVEVIKSPI